MKPDYILKFKNGEEHHKENLNELLESVTNILVDAEDGGAYKIKIKIEVDY